MEARVTSVHCVPNTHTWIIGLQDSMGVKMDHLLHPQLTELVKEPCPLLVPQRGIRLAGVTVGAIGSPPRNVVLPSLYLAVMLGTIPGVNDEYLMDEFDCISLSELSTYRGTEGAVTIAAKVLGIRQQRIYLTSPSSSPPTHIILDVPAPHLHVTKLVRKGELLRLHPKVPFSYDPQTPSSSIIEYVPGSWLCVLSSNVSMGDTSIESILNGPDSRDMRGTNCIKLREIGPNMSGISILARVAAIGANKPVNNHPRHPLQLVDVITQGHLPKVADVTAWDEAVDQLKTLRSGMLVFVENLTATSLNSTDNFYIIALGQTKIRNISILPAILTSSLSTPTPLSFLHAQLQAQVSYTHQPTNFTAHASITGYADTESPVHYAHSNCMRIARRIEGMMLECTFCCYSAPLSTAGAWEKIFQFVWKLEDGSAAIWATATPRVHEVLITQISSHCMK